MKREVLKITGHVMVKVRQGPREITISGPNLVTYAGQDVFADLLAGGSSDPISHVAMGTSSTVAAKSQTALGAEEQRVAGSVSATDNVITVTATFPDGVRPGDVTIAEFGLFNDDTAGDMIARWTSMPFTVVPEAEVQIEWSLKIGADE